MSMLSTATPYYECIFLSLCPYNCLKFSQRYGWDGGEARRVRSRRKGWESAPEIFYVFLMVKQKLKNWKSSSFSSRAAYRTPSSPFGVATLLPLPLPHNVLLSVGWWFIFPRMDDVFSLRYNSLHFLHQLQIIIIQLSGRQFRFLN